MGKPEQFFEKYFKSGSRGHGFICNFFFRYQDVFRHSEFTEPDALIHQVFLNLTSVRASAIKGEEDHYVIKAIYYQCWKIFYSAKEKQSRFVAESRLKRADDESTPGEAWSDDRPGPDDLAQGQDLLELIQRFRTGLAPNEAAILNGLLDESSATEIAGQLTMNLSTVNVTIFRLRKKLDAFLRDTGYRNNIKKNKKNV